MKNAFPISTITKSKQLLKSIAKWVIVFTFLSTVSDRNKVWKQIIPHWKDISALTKRKHWKNWKFWKWRRKMKMKKMSIFSTWWNSFIFTIQKLQTFQICNYFVYIFTRSKETACQNWSKRPKIGLKWAFKAKFERLYLLI